MNADDRGLMMENKHTAFSISPDTLDKIIKLQGRYFSRLSGLSPEKIASDLVDPKKALQQAYILGKHVDLYGKKVLEVGSGYGMNLVVWAKSFGMEVYGIEPDAFGFTSSCSVAKELFQRNGVDPSHIICSTGEHLPFSKDSFDIVYSTNVLEHAANPVCVLQEAMRVVKPDGVVQFVYPNYHSFFDGHYAIFHPPILSKGFFPWYVRHICKRDPVFAKTIRTELNLSWTRKQIDTLKKQYDLDVLSLGADVFNDRMLNADFGTWAGLGKVKKLVMAARRIGINRIISLLMRLSGTWTPIILTIRKKANEESI